MVELSGDGTYWNINTAGFFKTSYGAKRNVVYNHHTTAKQSAETVEATLSGEQSGTTPSTSMNAPTQTSDNVSASKGKGNSSSAQEQIKKVAKDQTPNANSMPILHRQHYQQPSMKQIPSPRRRRRARLWPYRRIACKQACKLLQRRYSRRGRKW